jgi:hypothetical protein
MPDSSKDQLAFSQFASSAQSSAFSIFTEAYLATDILPTEIWNKILRYVVLVRSLGQNMIVFNEKTASVVSHVCRLFSSLVWDCYPPKLPLQFNSKMSRKKIQFLSLKIKKAADITIYVTPSNPKGQFSKIIGTIIGGSKFLQTTFPNLKTFRIKLQDDSGLLQPEYQYFIDFSYTLASI